MINRAVVLLAGGLSVAGCVNLGAGKAPERLYTLSAARMAPAGVDQSLAGAPAIAVAEPDTDRVLAVARIPVRVNATQVAYLKDGVWSERPSRLFRGLLAETLRGAGHRIVFEDDQLAVRAPQRLSGRLEAMGYDAESRSVVVRYDALRTDGSGAVTQRRFEALEKGVAPKAADVAEALNLAANDVAAQVADWMK